jgi:hypothetical protein
MDPISREIASAVVEGSFLGKWWFYALVVGLPALGGAIGTFVTTVFTERIRGQTTKDVWYTQETWREKYKLYMASLEAIESVFQGSSHIVFDTRTLTDASAEVHSSFEAGVNRFPEHREALERVQQSMSRLIELSLGSELFLSKDAIDAVEIVQSSYVSATHAINLSYRARASMVSLAAGKSKVALIAAAKRDLQV